MKTLDPLHKILIPFLFLTLLTLPGLMAQDGNTNATQGTNSSLRGGGDWGKWRHHHEGEGFANLTEAERQQLKADFEKIKDDPQLQAAREAAKQAEESLRQLRNQLLLQTDPSVQPILDKLHQGPHAQGAPTSPSEN